MKSTKTIESLMSRAVADGVFPGGVLLAARDNEVLVSAAAGKTTVFPDARDVTINTVFDLASLTKPLATALAVMFLQAENRIDMDAPIYEYLHLPCRRDKKTITWLNLMCHNSGLPDYRPWYKTLLQMPISVRKDELYRMIEEEPIVYPVGLKTLYSDIGYLLLQQGVESAARMPFAAFVQEHVYPAFSVAGLFFPLASDVGNVNYAATEVCSFRGLLQGVVHDENAFAIGGAAGHAGLFGTAGAIFEILGKLVDAYGGKPVSSLPGAHIVSRFLTVPENAERTPGFDVPSAFGSSCGRYFNRDGTVGHLGYTGTSFWMDLGHKIIVILLTNRVHPSRKNEKIRTFRPFIHDAVMKLIL